MYDSSPNTRLLPTLNYFSILLHHTYTPPQPQLLPKPSPDQFSRKTKSIMTSSTSSHLPRMLLGFHTHPCHAQLPAAAAAARQVCLSVFILHRWLEVKWEHFPSIHPSSCRVQTRPKGKPGAYLGKSDSKFGAFGMLREVHVIEDKSSGTQTEICGENMQIWVERINWIRKWNVLVSVVIYSAEYASFRF